MEQRRGMSSGFLMYAVKPWALVGGNVSGNAVMAMHGVSRPKDFESPRSHETNSNPVAPGKAMSEMIK
jgi:hypothetical protein